MKISACILCRDDSSTLRACLESIRPHVDELIVVDTGSSDDSPAIAREFADRFDVFLGCNDPSTNLIDDFALARNHALSLATGDFHAWFDADDIVIGAEHLRPAARARDAETIQWLIPYDYAHDGAGRVTTRHVRENLVVPTQNFQWQTPVHECLAPKPGIVAVRRDLPQVRRIHRKELSKRPPDPQRNLRILQKYVKKCGEGDVRALYYLGVEFTNAGMIGDAFRTLRRYIQLSTWGDEKILATLEMARLYQAFGDQEMAIEWALKAMVTKSWPEPYWTLAECFHDLAAKGVDEETNFRKCAHFAELGMRLPDADTVLFVNPTKRFEVHRLLSVAYFKCGQVDRALESARAGLAGLPDDPQLQQNAKFFESLITTNRVVADLNRLHQLGVLPVESGQAMVNILAGAKPANTALPAPAQFVSPPPAEQARNEGALDIVLFVGPGYEPWNPDTLAKTGMGGSETMAWEMARRLRRIGHRVRLFGHCGPDAPEGVFEGVEWLDAQRYPGTTCDVLISSRQASAVDEAFGVKARARLLWIHDVHAGPELDQRRSLRFDRILALSEWHRSFLRQVYPLIDPGKFVVTRNGIDPDRFDALPPDISEAHLKWLEGGAEGADPIHSWRKPAKVIYSSSPDRGLPCLLELWPEVIKAVPDAELHVFYGAKNLELTIQMTGDPALAAMHRRTLAMVQSLPSVKMRGRVGQKELANEMLSAGVWVLPGGFSETSCIGAAEAQAAGCHIVASACAALNETIGSRGTLIGGFVEQTSRLPPDQPESYKREFAAALVAAIEAARVGPNVEGMTWVRANWTLDALAEEWDVMLRGLLAELDERAVPRFWVAA